MSMQFYAPPEQVMKDRADYARKGIARGRALVAAITASGVVLVAENPSRTLHKISEIYDRIAFAGVGRYSEYDQLRVAGVRHADTKGFAYAREDVDARSLANVYAQYLNQVFTHELKPLEVEILVAELGEAPAPSQLFQILYDGTVMDKDRFAVLGGDADRITEQLERRYEPGWDLAAATRACVEALAGEGRTLDPSDLEVAVLAAHNGRRAFARVEDDALGALLGVPGAERDHSTSRAAQPEEAHPEEARSEAGEPEETARPEASSTEGSSAEAGSRDAGGEGAER